MRSISPFGKVFLSYAAGVDEMRVPPIGRGDGAELWRDRYEPLEVVGRGGEGSVVRALDHLHHRPVALKIRRRGTPDEQEALLSEARLLLGMQPHPHVALARDDFFLDDRYVLVMDWIGGTSLAERLDREGSPGLPLDHVLRWLGEVAEALEHLHAHRPPVIHGDVKPANVVLTPEGAAVLVDFGIARRHPVPAGPVSGSAAYLAPELASGEPATSAADVFSLAATAFTLLVGEAPAPGVRPEWRRIAGDRAGEVETALRQGLAVDPTRRPASARAFVEALRGRATPPNNLPAALTTFVGRAGEIGPVADRLAAARLLTLVGTGGVGKTRLALHVAEQLLPQYPDGVFVVDLAPLDDPGLVVQQVLVTLGIAEGEAQEAVDTPAHGRSPTPRPLTRLIGHLVSRTALVVLDNCEHLVEVCASLADTLLRACVHLRILATSREPLRVPGESVWRVGPLPREEAARLFVERATSVRSDFELTPANAAAVASVCARLEGIPLAIELAAARTNVLAVDEIARRLDDRFRLLTGGSRTLPDRHRSLRAALDWTHDALTGPEQALFRRLSVFSGGFSLEAAEAVCPGGVVDQGDVLDLLSSLVDKSLVVSDGADTGRYRLLETLRQYAGEKLDAAGEANETGSRHLDWALAVAERPKPHVRYLDADHDNLRSALATAESTGASDELLRLTAALGDFWLARGYLDEGRRWVEAALAAGGEDHTPLRAKVLLEGGAIALEQGDFEAARGWFEDGIALAQRAGDEDGVIEGRHGLARVSLRIGDLARARLLNEENLAVRRRRGDRLGVAQSLLGLASVLSQQGEPIRDRLAESIAVLRTLDEPATLARALTFWAHSMQGEDRDAARAAHAEALAIHERLGDRLGMADTLAALANLEQVYANFPEAYELFERVLAIRREVGNRADLAQALFQMGQLIQYRGDYAEARRHFEESVAVGRAIGETHSEATGLEALALLAMFESDYAAAKPLLERALALARQRGDRSCEQQFLMTLGDAAWGEGDVEHAVSLYRESLVRAAAGGRKIRVVYCLERLGSAGALGDFPRSARLLGAAQGLRDTLGLARPPYGVPDWENDVGLARRALGDEEFERAWTEGYRMPYDELVAYAAEPPLLANLDRGGHALAGELAHGGDGAAREQAE